MLEIIDYSTPSSNDIYFMIEAMRNPKNSWDRSDTQYYNKTNYDIGDNDEKLMRSLVQGGPVHAKFRRMLHIMVTVNAPLYWWKEMDTYKVGTVRNSCSTMHKIHAKEFTLDDFSHEHLEDAFMDKLGTLCDAKSLIVLQTLINCLNYMRKRYLYTEDKKYWWQMIQLLPSSYNQRATLDLNYETLANIYKWRRNHKLDEWRTFCDWIEGLPLSDILIDEIQEEKNE